MPVFFPNSGSIETRASDIECAEKSISISAPSFCRQLKSLAKALVVNALMMATAPSTEPRARRFVFPTNRMRDLPFFDDAPSGQQIVSAPGQTRGIRRYRSGARDDLARHRAMI